MTKRKESLHGDGAGAITPGLPEPEPRPREYACRYCTEKEAFIVRLKDQIGRLQKVVRDQQEEVGKKKRYIDLYKANIASAITNLNKPLLPATTRRPARKGAGLE